MAHLHQAWVGPRRQEVRRQDPPVNSESAAMVSLGVVEVAAGTMVAVVVTFMAEVGALLFRTVRKQITHEDTTTALPVTRNHITTMGTVT